MGKGRRGSLVLRYLDARQYAGHLVNAKLQASPESRSVQNGVNPVGNGTIMRVTHPAMMVGMVSGLLRASRAAQSAQPAVRAPDQIGRAH